MPVPAQRTLVERFISWGRVEERLSRYEAIRRAFPLDLLRHHRDTPPYFCHYMGWRLGTWYNESLFARLEELLRRAESLPGWQDERNLLENPEFAVFWALVWQLQVAEHLCSVGGDVRWGNPGPDLSLQVDGKRFFVECYVFRKSFGLKLFLEDVLGHVGDDIKLDHDYCLPFSLPTNAATEAFLDQALRPFLDPAALERLRSQKQQYPVIVSKPGSTLVIYLDGDDDDKYDPTIVPSITGDPKMHIAVILKEAAGQKTGANSLRAHRPNLVAVNYLLSTDAQVAFHLRGMGHSVELPESIDGFAAAAGVGIDERLNRSQLLLLKARDPRDPILDAITTPM